MNGIELLIALVLLIGALFIYEYSSRPRSVAWHMRRMTRRVEHLSQTIGQRLAPAFAEAGAAVNELAVVLSREFPDLFPDDKT